jgi:predicted lactoylglutathione lyase
MMTPLAWSSLLTHNHFRRFTKKEIADANQVTEVLIAISAESRNHVDFLVDTAMDHGFMYQRSFADLDGHQWEVAWMDSSYIKPYSP